MASQIHELRNRLTTAALTATALLEGKLPADKSHLRDLVNALEDVKSIAATVSKHDWAHAGADNYVDVMELIRTVSSDLALAASAAEVALTVLEPAAIRCRTLRGPATAVYGAFEGALHALLSALPPGSSIAISPRAAESVTLTIAAKDGRPLPSVHLAELAPYLESRGGRVHLGDAPGEYCVHLPGKALCSV